MGRLDILSGQQVFLFNLFLFFFCIFHSFSFLIGIILHLGINLEALLTIDPSKTQNLEAVNLPDPVSFSFSFYSLL